MGVSKPVPGRAGELPTVSGVDLGERALGLPQHDGYRRVVLLHDRVGSCEEGPGGGCQLAYVQATEACEGRGEAEGRAGELQHHTWS